MANNASPAPSTGTGERMPDYNRTLGFMDLFFIAVGVIVGSGVMVFTGRAIAITGRSICLAYIGAAGWVICMGVPTILMCSCIRLIGGGYTQSNIFLGERWGGFYLSIYILSNMGLTLYAQTFARYFCELFPAVQNEKIVAIVMICTFYFINYFGVDFMAKAQGVMSSILLFVLVWFTVRGLPQVDWANFFGGEGWMTGGLGGLFRASTLLTYSLLGATSLMPYSAEAKNPRRDIPLAAAISTLVIATIFALMGIVSSGILPLEQVANQTLGVIANHVLTRPEYIMFMVGGALCAAATTLNGLIGSVTKPLVMMSHDGWLPKGLGKLSKHKTPYRYQLIYFGITVLPLLLNLDIGQVADMTLLGAYVQSALFIFFMRKIPDMFPEQWATSIFKMPKGVFTVLMWVCFAAALSNVWGMLSNSDFKTIVINCTVMVVGVLFSLLWFKSGRVTPSVSWEDA